MRAYLERYPDGLFADRAQVALDQIMADNQEQANAAEARAWRDAHNANTVSAYRRYLHNYPKGNFAQDASNRIVSLGVAANGGAAQERAVAVENALNLNSVTRGLVQGRLRQLGFETGRNIGQFDAQTRRAIRQSSVAATLRPPDI